MTYKALLSMRRQLLVFAIVMIAYHAIFTIGMAVMADPSNPRVLVQLTLGGPADFAGLFALVCGANLGLERSRYGPVALLFPVSRTRLALGTFVVDLGGLAVAYALACALEIGGYAAVHGFSALHGGSLLACVAIPFASIAALYGLSAFSSVVAGHGRLVGPILAVICFLALMLCAPDVPAHTTFQWLNVLNPAVYLYLATVELLNTAPEPLDLYASISLLQIAAILTAMAFGLLALTALVFRRTTTMPELL